MKLKYKKILLQAIKEWLDQLVRVLKNKPGFRIIIADKKS